MISPARDRPDAFDDELVPAPTHGGVTSRASAELRAAVTMLTRIPVRGETGGGTGAAACGVVGGVLGVVGMIPLAGLGGVAAPIAAILAVAVLAILSGAVHLDGLADTADALMATGPDGAERARTDPSVGVGGVVAVVLVLAVDVTSLALLALDGGPWLAGIAAVVAAGISRVVPVVLARLRRERAASTGLGGWFAARTTTGATLIAIASALVILLAGALGLGLAGAGVAVAVSGVVGGSGGLLIGIGLVRVRGKLDGDLLGASVELSFALTVLVAAALIGSVG